MTREAGKGCKPRPRFVPQEEYDDNWERIFGKKDKEENKDKQPKR